MQTSIAFWLRSIERSASIVGLVLTCSAASWVSGPFCLAVRRFRAPRAAYAAAAAQRGPTQLDTGANVLTDIEHEIELAGETVWAVAAVQSCW